MPVAASLSRLPDAPVPDGLLDAAMFDPGGSDQECRICVVITRPVPGDARSLGLRQLSKLMSRFHLSQATPSGLSWWDRQSASPPIADRLDQPHRLRLPFRQPRVRDLTGRERQQSLRREGRPMKVVNRFAEVINIAESVPKKAEGKENIPPMYPYKRKGRVKKLSQSSRSSCLSRA